jgi:phage shock protein PspC (stress-responsive transcriptional regulator)
MVAGVCEGLGRYFDVDPVIFRIGFAVAAFAGGAGLLAYVIAALVIPEEGSRRAAVHFGRKTPTVVMWVLIVLGVLALTDGWGHHRPFGFGWGIVVLAGIGWLIWSHEQRRDPPAVDAPVAHPPTESRSVSEFSVQNASVWEDREAGVATAPAPRPDVPRERSILGRLTLSVLLVGAGAALLLAQQADDVTGHGVEAALAVGLLVVAAALFVGAWWGRAKPLIAIGVLFTIAAAGASLVDVPLKGGAGDRTWDPVASVRPAYRLGVGDATLDLTNVAGDRVDTKASVGIGHLRVVVPHDATVDVDAHAGLGEVRVLGRTADGTDAERSVQEAGSELGPKITLDVRVGVGQVEVVRDAA